MAQDRWYRMDNVAKVFLASANERDTRTFRMTCTLKDEIDKDILGIEKESILEESQKDFYSDKDIKSRLSAVKEFQQEIGEPEDKEFIEMVNKNRAQIMAEKNTREQQRAVEQRKNDILDKFFEENL